jgi:L-lactate dehydrogenase
MLKKKGGAGFAVGIAIRDVIEAIALDRRCVLPITTVQGGAFGIRDIALSVPTIVNASGAGDRLELDLWPKEIQGLRASAAALKKTLDQVLIRLSRNGTG